MLSDAAKRTGGDLAVQWHDRCSIFSPELHVTPLLAYANNPDALERAHDISPADVAHAFSGRGVDENNGGRLGVAFEPELQRFTEIR